MGDHSNSFVNSKKTTLVLSFAVFSRLNLQEQTNLLPT